jgi:regulator of replication initiation timing
MKLKNQIIENYIRGIVRKVLKEETTQYEDIVTNLNNLVTEKQKLEKEYKNIRDQLQKSFDLDDSTVEPIVKKRKLISQKLDNIKTKIRQFSIPMSIPTSKRKELEILRDKHSNASK